MKRVIAFLEKTLFYVYEPIMDINIILIIIWPLVITTYVILRSFGISILFVEEYSEYWLIIISYTTFAFAFRAGSHISVNILTDNVKGITKNLLEIITDVIMIFTLIVLFDKAKDWLSYGLKTKAVSGYPSRTLLWPIYVFPVVGFALLLIEIFIKTIKDFKAFSIKKN